MSQDKCSHITPVSSFTRVVRTVFVNGKNQLHVVQSNAVITWNLISGPVVEVILNGELLWQIGSLFLDKRLYLGIVSQVCLLYTSPSPRDRG